MTFLSFPLAGIFSAVAWYRLILVAHRPSGELKLAKSGQAEQGELFLGDLGTP